MAQRIVLHYSPGNSFLHRWDGRCKFFGLLMVTASLLFTHLPWLVLNSALLFGLLIFSRLPLGPFFRDARTWLIFLLLLFLFQVCFTPGPRLLVLPWIPVSKDGFYVGAFTFWRLGLMLGYAVLFTAVTRPRELQDAVVWLLKPIPILPGRRIGLMVALTFRFFSLVLDEAEEVRLANRARFADRNKSPFRKAKALILPILHRSFSRAEDVTLALAARGYREDIPLMLAKLRYAHLIPLAVYLGSLFVTGWAIPV